MEILPVSYAQALRVIDDLRARVIELEDQLAAVRTERDSLAVALSVAQVVQ